MTTKRRILILATILVLGAAAGSASFGQTQPRDTARKQFAPDPEFAPPKLWNRVEITLFGGIGIPIAGWTSFHFTQSGAPPDLLVASDNKIKTSSTPDVFAGAAVTFFLPSGVGIQFGFGYLKAGLASDTQFKYDSSGTTTASFTSEEHGEGELTAVPVFLCLFNQFHFRLGGKTIRAYLTAGPTLSFNSVLSGSRAGAGVLRGERADAIIVPVSIEDTTWISFGATAGVGVDIPLSAHFALVVEGRYFYAPRENFSWTWTPGAYDGVFHNLAAFDFDKEAAARYESDTTPLTINPSFIQFAGGIKLIF